MKSASHESNGRVRSSSWAYFLSLYVSPYRGGGASYIPPDEEGGFARLLRSRDPEAEGGGTERGLDPGMTAPLFCWLAGQIKSEILFMFSQRDKHLKEQVEQQSGLDSDQPSLFGEFTIILLKSR